MCNVDNDYKYSLDTLEKLASNIFSDLSSYQDHKENMANAGFLFEVAFLSGYIVNKNLFTDLFNSKCTLFFLILSIWIITHLFIRWQLGNRKKAALEQNGILLSMSGWVTQKPNLNDLRPHIPCEPSFKSKVYFFLDFLFPMPYLDVPKYIVQRKYPKCLFNGIKKMYDNHPYAALADYCISIGSLIILISFAFLVF